MTLVDGKISANSSVDMESSCDPEMAVVDAASTPLLRSPNWSPIARAVGSASPVTIFTLTPDI